MTGFTKQQLDEMVRDAENAHEDCERCNVCVHVKALVAEADRLTAIVDRVVQAGVQCETPDGQAVMIPRAVWMEAAEKARAT